MKDRALIPLKLGFIDLVKNTSFGSWRRGLASLLCFHEVASNNERLHYGMGQWTITTAFLEEIIKFYLQENFEILSLDELYSHLLSYDHSRKVVAFTFDDGYRDILTNVYPLMKQYQLPFATYVVPNFISGKLLKWDSLCDLVVEENSELVLDSADGRIAIDCSSGNKSLGWNELHRRLLSLNNPRSYHFIEEFFLKYLGESRVRNDGLLLNWDEIQLLAKDELVTIGAHTNSHYVLSQLTEGEVRAEMLQSRQCIESKIGLEVKHLAYPYGGGEYAGVREYNIAKELGFRTAVTSLSCNVYPQNSDYTACLPRNGVRSDSSINNVKMDSYGFQSLWKRRVFADFL